jgi:cell division protein FtsB
MAFEYLRPIDISPFPYPKSDFLPQKPLDLPARQQRQRLAKKRASTMKLEREVNDLEMAVQMIRAGSA